ncbi:ComEA family DNA-binding protein [Pelistega europaea]|nr:DUF655 domain-containing protein [Pelistega europaea]
MTYLRIMQWMVASLAMSMAVAQAAIEPEESQAVMKPTAAVLTPSKQVNTLSKETLMKVFPPTNEKYYQEGAQQTTVKKQYYRVGLTHTVSQIQTVDVNTASLQQLISIKGIGKKTAERIIAERQRAGIFISFDDLSARVKGMNKKKLLKLHMLGLRVGNSPFSNETLDLQNSQFPAPIHENFIKRVEPVREDIIRRTGPRIAEGQILQIKNK